MGDAATLHKRSYFTVFVQCETAEVLNKEAIYLSYVPLLQMINWSTLSAYCVYVCFLFTFVFFTVYYAQMLSTVYFFGKSGYFHLIKMNDEITNITKMSNFKMIFFFICIDCALQQNF